MRAAPVNYVDLLVIGGGYQFAPKLPFIPGKGPAGVVRAAGAGVTTLKPGDRVLAMAEHGGYAELVSVAADQCYRLPDGAVVRRRGGDRPCLRHRLVRAQGARDA